MKFPEYVSFTLEKLEKNGFDAYLVGGCVRDFLMGIAPHDFDITTNATPDEIETCFSDIKTLNIGKKHGTITLVFDKECVEVTTYRIDGEYKDSRHPESVTFTDKIEEDLSRRDFTMNAIAYSPKIGFADPFNGRADIQKQRIVAVGNPENRFDEDALRIMRALRFSSRLGFEIEQNTKMAIHCKKELLLNIAMERLNSELCGILEGNFAPSVIADFHDVFCTVIPKLGSVDCMSIARAQGFDILTKLSLFFSHFTDSKELTALLKYLKFDNNTIKSVTAVVSLFNVYFSKCSDSDIKRAVSKIGVENTKILYQALYSHLDNKSFLYALSRLNKFIENGDCMTVSSLAVKGNEIIEKCAINPSKTGVILASLLDDVIDGKVPNEMEPLLERAKIYTQH